MPSMSSKKEHKFIYNTNSFKYIYICGQKSQENNDYLYCTSLDGEIMSILYFFLYTFLNFPVSYKITFITGKQNQNVTCKWGSLLVKNYILTQQQYKNQIYPFVLSGFSKKEQWCLVNQCCNSLSAKIPLFLTAFKISSKYPLCLFWYGEKQGQQAKNHFSFYCKHPLFQIPSLFPSSDSNNVPSFSQGTGAYRPWLTDQAIWVKSWHKKENKFDLALLPLVCPSVKVPCGCLSIENTS